MSEGMGRLFVPILRDVERRLGAPPRRSLEILRELEADLESLREELEQQGLSTEEARSRALEALVPDADTAEVLSRLHLPAYRRLTRRFTEPKVRILERSALAAATLAITLLQAVPLLRADLLRDPSSFLWPVLILGAGLAALILAQAFQVLVKGEEARGRLSLGPILGVAGLIVALGIGGTAVDMYRLMEVLEANPELAGVLVHPWLVRTSALLSVSVILSLLGAVAWFVLTYRVSSLSSERTKLLELEVPRSREGRP